MPIHGVGRWAGAMTAVLGLAVLAPPDAWAQPIRVLLVIPRESSELSRQAARLEDAIAAVGGPIVLANRLADADAVVQLTDHRRRVAENGETEDWWDGQFKLLTPVRRTRFPVPAAERFSVVIWRDKADVTGLIAQALAQTLAKALGREIRETRPPGNEAI
jgi:hypothetical protein